MKYALFLALLFPLLSFSQNTPSAFWGNRCDYKTDGSGKSLGVKLKLSVPCDWTQADGDRPHIVKKFSHGLSKGQALNYTLTMSTMPGEPSEKEISEMFSPQGLKAFAVENSTYISGRKVKIDGINCGEIVFKIIKSTPALTMNIYFIQYYIPYKDKMINLSFAASGLSGNDAKTLFNTYKVFFQSLATTTIVISKWE